MPRFFVEAHLANVFSSPASEAAAETEQNVTQEQVVSHGTGEQEETPHL